MTKTFGLIAITLFAQVLQAGEFTRGYRSAYFLGRGDTGIAVADNEDAIFYNPAGLARGKGLYKKTVFASPMIEFSENTRDLGRQLGIENSDAINSLRKQVGKTQHAGLYNFTGIVMRRAAIGAFAASKTNLLVSKDPANGIEKVSADTDQLAGLTFSVAEKIYKEYILLGTTLKYLYRGQAAVELNASEATEASQLNPQELVGSGSGTGSGSGQGIEICLSRSLAAST